MLEDLMVRAKRIDNGEWVSGFLMHPYDSENDLYYFHYYGRS